MIDISSIALEAASRKHDADPRQAHLLASRIGANVSWEPQESWASLLRPGLLAGHVHVRSPLVIISRPLINAILVASSDQLVLPVDDMDAPSYRVDADAFEALFDETLEQSGLDAEGFAISDLWFATVT